MQAQIQGALQALCGIQLVDLHISDLLNQQLPSRYDYTSQYDLLVFRRLTTGSAEADLAQKGLPPNRLANETQSAKPAKKRDSIY